MMNGNGPTRSATVQAQRQKQLAQAQAQSLTQGNNVVDKQAKMPQHFATTSQEILQKYQKYPALISLHIFENHYRFNNSLESQVIPKNLPMIKDFLHHVLKETIPVELLELVKDFSIRLYDGCLILQVFDHREMVEVLVKQQNGTTAVQKKPKTYRTLLRPTQLLIYYDLLYHTDAALFKFHDPLSLQMELEILTLTNRELDLLTPLNPYLCDDYLKPELEYPKKVWNEEKGDYDLVFSHREETKNPIRKLHQDEIVLHKLSDYEEIMLLMLNKYKNDNTEQKLVVVGQPAIAGAVPPGLTLPQKPKEKSANATPPLQLNRVPSVKLVLTGPPRSTGQFMRLRLIEEYRKRKDAKQAAQVKAINQVQPQGMAPNVNMGVIGGPGGPNSNPNNSLPALMGGTPQPRPQIKQEMMPQQLPPQQPPMPPQQQHPPPQMQQPQQQPPPPPQSQQQHQQAFAQQQNHPQMKRQKVSAAQVAAAQQQHMNLMPLTPAVGLSMPLSMGTPVMPSANGNMMPQRPQPHPQLQFMDSNTGNNPANQNQNNPMPPQMMPNMGNNPGPQPLGPPQGQQRPSVAQLQQQQILNNTLSPEERAVFRQLQLKVQGYQQMANTGVTPNGQQLTPQQKQTAMNHARAYQHQLIQKFPLYFQRVSQFRLLQQQRQQQQQQNMMNQQQRH